MKFLVVGSGGREHAIAWKLAQSYLVKEIFVAPGNAGTAKETKTTNIEIASFDIKGLCDFAQRENIDYTIVGPEASLAAGIYDLFASSGLKCFGVNQIASQLESSKLFTKKLLNKYAIPTADFMHFTDYEKALSYCQTANYPLVIKADGLAEGKGVTIASQKDEALVALDAIMKNRIFGAAGDSVVIEEYLSGFETSSIAIVCGTNYLPFVDVQDHKRLKNNDEGPNTGGMGVFSPAATITKELTQKIQDNILTPIVQAIAAEGIDYQGFLFVGLMVKDGEPRVLEINCRLGDPETQAILLRLESDFAELIIKAMNQDLASYKIAWQKESVVNVVLAAEGYPNNPQKGAVIPALQNFSDKNITIFHAGTKINDKGEYVVAGGRVLNIAVTHADIQKARTKLYQAIEKLAWSGCQYRTDI